MTDYALCWEDPGGDEAAWTIRTRDYDFPTWDVWLFHPDLGEGDAEVAKAWAAERITAEGRKVTGWRRDRDQDLIPEFEESTATDMEQNTALDDRCWVCLEVHPPEERLGYTTVNHACHLRSEGMSREQRQAVWDHYRRVVKGIEDAS